MNVSIALVRTKKNHQNVTSIPPLISCDCSHQSFRQQESVGGSSGGVQCQTHCGQYHDLSIIFWDITLQFDSAATSYLFVCLFSQKACKTLFLFWRKPLDNQMYRQPRPNTRYGWEAEHKISTAILTGLTLVYLKIIIQMLKKRNHIYSS